MVGNPVSTAPSGAAKNILWGFELIEHGLRKGLILLGEAILSNANKANKDTENYKDGDKQESQNSIYPK